MSGGLLGRGPSRLGMVPVTRRGVRYARSTPRKMSLLSQVQDSAAIKIGAKVLVFGPSQSGKSHDFFVAAPRPLLVVDSDANADKFADERFEGFQHIRLYKMDDLLNLLDELIAEAENGKVPFRSLMIDSLTVIVDRTIASLGIDVSTGPVSKVGQSTFARIAKELTYKFRVLSAYNINICVIAEERTRYKTRHIDPTAAEVGASLSPQKFGWAFDLAYHKLAQDEVEITKSRYQQWVKGQVIPSFDATTHLKPLLNGGFARVRGMEEFNPPSGAHEKLLGLLQERKSISKGGVIPNREMARYLALVKDEGVLEADVKAAISEIEREYPAVAA